MRSASTIRPGISVNYSNVKQCFGLWLPSPTNTQVSNLSAPSELSHTMGSFVTGDQIKEARSLNASWTSLCLQLIKPPKQQSRACSILNCALQPSQTEGKDNSGFLYHRVRPSQNSCANKSNWLLAKGNTESQEEMLMSLAHRIARCCKESNNYRKQLAKLIIKNNTQLLSMINFVYGNTFKMRIQLKTFKPNYRPN